MKKKKGLTLEESLQSAMKSIDNQIAREMQRSPAKRDSHGVEKWEPIQTRVERVTTYALNSVSTNNTGLDSLLVLSQALTKALSLHIQELGEEGLGQVRSSYCKSAIESISRDCFLASKDLEVGQELN